MFGWIEICPLSTAAVLLLVRALSYPLADHVSGQVMPVNWRATRLGTWSHDMALIPNSVVSIAIVTNHSRPNRPHRCIVRLGIDLAMAPSRVIEALRAAGAGSPYVARRTIPQTYACAFLDSLMDYELAFAIDSFAQTPGATSEMTGRIADAFHGLNIRIGTPVMDVRVVQGADPAVATGVRHGTTPAQADETP